MFRYRYLFLIDGSTIERTNIGEVDESEHSEGPSSGSILCF